MTFNFALNNVLTYRDKRLRGMRWLRGWLSFNIACSLGACMNVGLATYLNEATGTRYLAALAGIAGWRGMELCGNEALTWSRGVETHRP